MQKDKLLNVSVPVKYEMLPFADDRFKKCKVLVMHEGLNLNGSIFSMDAMEKAKESIKNIPILAFVKQNDGNDDADFGGHESEIVLSNDGIKFRYLGRPIGIIPADNCDYHYEIYNDKTYVAVTGYIWTDYANEALDILESSGEKGQSMEIRVDDGDWDERDYFNITSYRYTGVTILGDNVTPAMTGAKVQLFSADNKAFSDEYFAMVDELNVALKNHASQSQESEDNKDMDKDKGLETPIENEGKGDEGVIQTNSAEGVQTPVVEGEGLAEKSETTPIVENPVDYSAQILTLNTELFNLRNEYQTLEVEVLELREYKRLKELAETKAKAEAEYAKKEAIFSEFSFGLTDEEMQPVKDCMEELTSEKITEKLNAIFTVKNLTQLKNKKFNSDTNKNGVVIDLQRKDDPKSKYAV